MANLPKWISSAFSDALKKYLENENVKILEHTTSLALPKGSNYTTDIFRTAVTYADGDKEIKDMLLIIKVCPDNEILINYDKQSRLFEQEITVYTELLPAIHEILSEETTLAARYVGSIKEPRSAMILEDLTTTGFRMHSRENGLDLEHCLLALKTLAYFHASSAVLYKKNPSIITRYNLGIFWDNPFTRRWLDIGFDSLAKACTNWPGYERYFKKLQLVKDKAIEKTLAAIRLSVQDFSVLNHGDFWINNFMFSYTSDGKLKECRIVDFQVVLHSSPAIDVNYFWSTSPNIEVRNEHLNMLLKYYYKCLIEQLNKMEYPLENIPSLKQFEKDFNTRAFYGLATSVTVLPFVTASTRSDASFEDMLTNESENGFRYDSYNNERYRKCMEYLLPYYDNLGVFN